MSLYAGFQVRRGLRLPAAAINVLLDDLTLDGTRRSAAVE